MLGLDSLDKQFSRNNKSDKPTDVESIQYLFWKKGISLKEFNELPIPYIMNMVNTYSYYKELEIKEYKKKR